MDEKYSDFLLHIEKENERKLKKLAKELNAAALRSDDFFTKKRKSDEKKRWGYIKYIVKKDKTLSADDLNKYSTRDLIIIYNEIRERRKNFLKRIFNLFINN